MTCDIVIGGMDCAACAAAVERSVKAVPGVTLVTVDVLGASARVRHHRGVARTQLVDAIRRAGYRVE